MFAARTAARLGLRTAVVTSAPEEYIATVLPQLPGVAVHNRAAAHPSTFVNIYQDGHRQQFLPAQAGVLGADDVPAAWRESAIVHFGPVANEVERSLLESSLFPAALRGATPQGWLRTWDADGQVHTARGAAAAALMPSLPVLVFSEEDIEREPGVVAACRARCEIVAVTAGAQGATIYRGDEAFHFAAFPTREVDPTGAGDVFAAAFLARYRATGDLITAGRYASVAASFVVEAPGADGIPTAAQIAERLSKYEEWLVVSG
jgi:sugar/nucleoside kinase (ribokinase family)